MRARIASSASIVGNVQIGARAYVDHGVVIASSGPPVEIADEVIVFAGAMIRSSAVRAGRCFRFVSVRERWCRRCVC
jgi:carbonic anhydrase/acetyltransferase-like protein (isoleucine patch superfamily)